MKDRSAMNETVNSDTDLAALEARVKVLEELLERVGEAMEQAKSNPMLANLMKMFGV
jgi:hypothetical protein